MKLKDFLPSDSASRIPDWLNEKSNTKRMIEINFSDGEFRSFDGKSNGEIAYSLLQIMYEKKLINDISVTELKLYEIYTRSGNSDYVYAFSIDEAISNSKHSASVISEVKEVED